MIYAVVGITLEPGILPSILQDLVPETSRRFGYFLTLDSARAALEDRLVYDWCHNATFDGPDQHAFLFIEVQMPGLQDLDGCPGYVNLNKSELYKVYWEGDAEDADVTHDLLPRDKWPAWATRGHNFTFDLE